MKQYDALVIGGGAAGCMAAYAAAKGNHRVLLLEKNEKLGKKIFITGKGRCNITNACDADVFFENVVRNPKFMMSAYYGFSNDMLLDLLHGYGLRTKVERGGRVFPVSDHSSDVIQTLRRMLEDVNVQIAFNSQVLEIKKTDDGFIVRTNNGSSAAHNVVIATGGVSYPTTGSTGDGYEWARQFGHSICPPMPALVALEDKHRLCARMQGLTLKNIGFSLFQQDKLLYSEQGELLFTHFGISGPVVLSASSFIDYTKNMDALYCTIDLKPALDEKTLDARLVRDFAQNQNKQLKTYMPQLMPSKLIAPFLQESGLDGALPINRITKEQRSILVQKLKEFKIAIADARPVEEAIITAGGVDVKQVNPSTMQSRLAPGLYFAGEVLDVSALTGGFNLQIAFSTGYLAGNSINHSVVV